MRFPNYINILATIAHYPKVMPFYHAISNYPPAHLRHLYPIFSEKKFELDLDFFLKFYQPISVPDLLTFLKKNQPIPKNSVLISFDDGLREFGEVAFPILQRKGIPSAVFINPNFTENQDMFFRLKTSLLLDTNQKKKVNWDAAGKLIGKEFKNDSEKIYFLKSINYSQSIILDQLSPYFEIDFKEYQQQVKPYLTLEELKELQSKGVHIGSHSWDHPQFNQLELTDQLLQVAKSVEWIRTHLKSDISTFSFPFTDDGVSHQFFDKIKESHPFFPKVTFGCAGLKKETYSYHFQRIPMEKKFESAKYILTKQYLFFLLKGFFGRNKVKRPLS